MKKKLELRPLVISVLFVLMASVLCAGTASASYYYKYDGSYSNGYLKPDNEFTLNEAKVFLDGTEGQQYTTISGHVGGQTDQRLIYFTSTEGIEWTNSGSGFATIKAADGLLNNLTIYAPKGYAFEDLYFSVMIDDKIQADLDVITNIVGGGEDQFLNWQAINEGGEKKWVKGQNDLLVLVDTGYLMQSVEIWSEAGITGFTGGGLEQVKHVKVSGYTQVPEPTTMLLLGFGLVGLAGVGRKFKK